MRTRNQLSVLAAIVALGCTASTAQAVTTRTCSAARLRPRAEYAFSRIAAVRRMYRRPSFQSLYQ